MIKSELIEKLAAENTHLTHAEVERLVNTILGKMTGALSEGGRVELRGFGAFSVKNRPARTGRARRMAGAAARAAGAQARGAPLSSASSTPTLVLAAS